MKRKIFSLLILTFIAILIYHLQYGRLFLFSPLITGFNKQEYQRAIIYYQSADISGFGIIDSLVKEVEQFHGPSFNRKVGIFICHSDRQYQRYTGSTARFITGLIYGRIFVSARAVKDYENNKIHLDRYLKHELSHSLLYQNMSLLHSLRYPGWFMEGLATYSAGQMGVDGYLTPEETVIKIKEGYFVEPEDWGTAISGKGRTVKEIALKKKFHFIYAEFALMISDLIQTHGESCFRKFLQQSLHEKDFNGLFLKTFGTDLESYVENFKSSSH